VATNTQAPASLQQRVDVLERQLQQLVEFLGNGMFGYDITAGVDAIRWAAEYDWNAACGECDAEERANPLPPGAWLVKFSDGHTEMF
jgi:hypothetical protein